jgi:hypothetical protein
MSNTDPYREPENSTVDEWFGQSVSRDEELADEIAGRHLDENEAERQFEEASRGAEQQRERRRGA